MSAESRLRVLPLRIVIETQAPAFGSDVHPGAAGRGILVSALNYVACICKATSRSNELHLPTCPASIVLDGPRPQEGRPYAIARASATLNKITFDLLLYQAATKAWPVVAEALLSLESHGVGSPRVPVTRVTAHHLVTGERFLSNSDVTPTGALPIALPFPRFETCGARTRVQISTEGPLTLGRDTRGAAVRPPSLEGLLEALRRRYESLGGLATIKTPANLYSAILDASVAPSSRERTSARSRRRMPLAGVEGWWTIEANLSEETLTGVGNLLRFLPVGGRTAFGHGALAISPA